MARPRKPNKQPTSRPRRNFQVKFQGQMKTNNESVEETVLNSIHTTNDNNQDAEDDNDQNVVLQSSVSHMHDGIYTRSRLFTTATSSSAH